MTLRTERCKKSRFFSFSIAAWLFKNFQTLTSNSNNINCHKGVKCLTSTFKSARRRTKSRQSKSLPEKCPKGEECDLVKIGKCIFFHPKCKLKLKCHLLPNKWCPYYHPPAHFDIEIQKKAALSRRKDIEKRNSQRLARPQNMCSFYEDPLSDPENGEYIFHLIVCAWYRQSHVHPTESPKPFAVSSNSLDP